LEENTPDKNMGELTVQETNTNPEPEKTIDENAELASVPKTYSMWDAFEHIILFISLYVFATSLTLLFYLFIDKWVPSNTSYRSYAYAYSYFSTGLTRSYLSSIIVSYPIFAFLFLRLNKKNLANPAIRLLRSRKFLIYFTLVVTFIITLVSVTAIVFSFLNGNVTANSALKFLITIIVSMTIFGYWSYQVKEDRHYA
jgi:hypothetical protein